LNPRWLDQQLNNVLRRADAGVAWFIIDDLGRTNWPTP
jgi:hypothetical protein